MTDNIKNENWEKSTLHKLLFSSLIEQRRKRRWKIFFWLLFFGYVFFMTWNWFQQNKPELYSTDTFAKSSYCSY